MTNRGAARRFIAAVLTCAVGLGLGAVTSGCDTSAPAGPLYYERVIQPILTGSCSRGQAPCHRDDGRGTAMGNLDLSGYEQLTRRPDVLRRYGSYPVPLFLLKAAGSRVPPVPYRSAVDGTTVFLASEIDHVGGATLSVDSPAFLELERWLAHGATRTGLPPARPPVEGTGGCLSDFSRARPDLTARSSSVDAADPGFVRFTRDIEPYLANNCASASCHSTDHSDFFLTCQGNGTDEASKVNFLSARALVSAPPETSELLLRILDPSEGGTGHTGGVFIASRQSTTWQDLRAWAAEVGPEQPAAALDEGRRFFAAAVMPVLLKRGCALEGCHSPGAPNDLKLRAGQQGWFSAWALEASYLSARDFLAPEVPDPRQSRIIKKPIVAIAEGGFGITHRGGPVLQSTGDPVADPEACPQTWTSASSAFCTLVEWHRRERSALLSRGEVDALLPGAKLSFVVVRRPADGDTVLDFDTYRPGADLLLTSLKLGALGRVAPDTAGEPVSLLGHCPGDPSARDVRGPDVSYDASRVAFAMRTGPADSLDLYEVSLDPAQTCTKLTDGNGAMRNGLPVHSFDPAYAPDGSLVFASTRGRPDVGPTRSLKHGTPQADLWRMLRSQAGYGPPEQMTWLLGSELSPAMMANGQISMTVEKGAPGFYQLSGRRINWDLTDYHPLLAQRADSPAADGTTHASIGYQQATEIREGIDRDFLVVLSDSGTRGAGGTVGIFNRSLGPFQQGREDVTFLRSLSIPDGNATGRAGATVGAYRSPIQLPDGRILASYAQATNLAQATALRYDLVVLDPATGARTPVPIGPATSSYVEAMPVYRRGPRRLFTNSRQIVFGGVVDPSDREHAEQHFPDLPMLGTLLGANLRSGRAVAPLRTARELVVWESLPPLDAADLAAGQSGPERIYSRRAELGRAALAEDGSVHLRVPAARPLIYELRDAGGATLFTMSEEDQLGPGERINRGVPERHFDSVCGGCHGSVSGRELDVAVRPDALTGASVSLSRGREALQSIGP